MIKMLEELFTPEYERLVKEAERTAGHHYFLTEQECRLFGSTCHIKNGADPYAVSGYLRYKPKSKTKYGKKVKEIRNKREELKYSIALIGKFDIPEEEVTRLHDHQRFYVLVDLKPIDNCGRTVADPDVVDQNGKIIEIKKKQAEGVCWRVNKATQNKIYISCQNLYKNAT